MSGHASWGGHQPTTGQPTGAVRRTPSITDVAARAGVSHQTVSRVLNDHPNVRDDTRRRVRAAIADLGYRPNSAARALATRRSDTIGVLAAGSSLHGPVSALLSLEEAARARGLQVIVGTLRRYEHDEVVAVLDRFLDQGVDGVIAVTPTRDVAAAVDGVRLQVPTVLLCSRAAPDVPTLQAASPSGAVGIDQHAGAAAAVDHLVALGHREIAHLTGPGDWYDAAARLDGWRTSMRAHGLQPHRLVHGDWSAESGYAAGMEVMARPASERPTAVFAANDQMALGFLLAVQQRGLRVPQDLSVVGFDDIAGSAYFAPPLTTVRQPFDDLGRRALTALAALIGAPAMWQSSVHSPDQARPQTVEWVEPELVVRASSGPSSR